MAYKCKECNWRLPGNGSKVKNNNIKRFRSGWSFWCLKCRTMNHFKIDDAR